MELNYLKLFNALATQLSVSKAAEMLYISQPAVSMQMKKLEANLGMKLFDKIGKKLYLNENGQLLFEYTSKIFSLIEDAEAQLSSVNSNLKGVVKIGSSNTPGTYILPRILGKFMETRFFGSFKKVVIPEIL
jgi:DNA-binding transcriptional LysR family regulator